MILLKKDIKKLVSYYIKKFDTTNPFEIADALGIIVQTGKLGIVVLLPISCSYSYIHESL